MQPIQKTQHKMKNDFFPCLLVEHDNSFSIICSEFHFFDDYFGDKGGGGYSVERLAKKLAKEHNIKIEVDFDSEAGMFCAFSNNRDSLLKLCNLLQEITGPEENHLSQENTRPLIPLEEAEKLLLNAFVFELNDKLQEEFLNKVPYPSLTNKQRDYINAIENGSVEEKISAAKKINSEARTGTRDWDNYLSHPNTISTFLYSIDKETNPKVTQELIWALVFICDRHLPDLRTKDCFLKALESENTTTRWLGLMGLKGLYEYPESNVIKMRNDKSQKVREEAEDVLKKGMRKEFPGWMFKKNYK